MPGRLRRASRLRLIEMIKRTRYGPLRNAAVLIKARPFGWPNIRPVIRARPFGRPSSRAMLVLPSGVIKARPFGWPSGKHRRAEGRRKLIPNRFGWPPTATNARRFTVTPSAEGSEAVDQLRSPPAAPSVRWISNLSELLVPPSEVIKARPFGWPISTPSSFSLCVVFGFFIVGFSSFCALVPERHVHRQPLHNSEMKGGLSTRVFSRINHPRAIFFVFFLIGVRDAPFRLK